MKTLIFPILLLSLFFPLILPAQNNTGFNYQAQVKGDNNQPLSNQTVAVQINIFSGSATGTSVYREVHNNVRTDTHGYFSIVIGNGSAQQGNFSQIDWMNANHFLSVSINGKASGVQRLEAVPYSKVATAMQLGDLADVGDQAPQNGQALVWNGSAWSPGTVSGGNTGGTLWKENSGDIFFNGGNVGIGIEEPIYTLEVKGDAYVEEVLETGAELITGGFIEAGGTILARRGVAEGLNREGNTAWRLTYFTDSGTGVVRTFGPNGSFNVDINNVSGNSNHGYVSLKDAEDRNQAAIYVSEDGDGRGFTRGTNGNINISLNSLNDNPDHGYLSIENANKEAKVRAYVNADGEGVLAVDGVKPFFMEHPTQPDKNIWYCAIEGPEAGAYFRGTGQVVNGEGTVTFPDHFSTVINPETMTITLTPLSAESKGMAVIRKEKDGFVVKELLQGTGNYAFDWEVKAVRKGYEDWRVVRDKNEDLPARLSEPAKPEGASQP